MGIFATSFPGLVGVYFRSGSVCHAREPRHSHRAKNQQYGSKATKYLGQQ